MQPTLFLFLCLYLAMNPEIAIAQTPTKEIISNNAKLVTAALSQATALMQPSAKPTASRTDYSQPSALDYNPPKVPSATTFGTTPSVTPTLLPSQELAQNRPSTPTPKTTAIKTTATGLTVAQLTTIATAATTASPTAFPIIPSAPKSAVQSRSTSTGLAAPTTSSSSISPSGLGDYIPPRSAASQAHCRQRNNCITGEYCDAALSFMAGEAGGSCKET